MEFAFKKGFGSDNHCPVHPKIMQALVDANRGHLPSYGTDELCTRATDVFRKHFGSRTEVFFVFNGTAANTLSLRAMTRSFNTVFCADISHIYNDECAAPEIIGQCKLIPLAAKNGKITAAQIEEHLVRLGDQHATQPKAVSITQPTEMGTVYSIEEIKTICDVAKRHGLYVHIDGARLPNACVSLNCTFSQMTSDLGVDVVSFGGTKNSLMFGEAILFLNTTLAKDFQYIRKQCLQLPSKSRYIAAQFLALFDDNLWRTNSEYILKLAKRLRDEVRDIPHVKVTQEVQSNAVFAEIPKSFLKPLREKFFFYVWDERTFECRWMISFDTTEQEIIEFAQILRELSKKM